MIKIFKDKKNVVIASSLILAVAGVGRSAFALARKPHCPPPPKPEMHCAERFERHDCLNHDKCPEFAEKHGDSQEGCKHD